jgi:L,D-transpeptidase ErfK/SrfK
VCGSAASTGAQSASLQAVVGEPSFDTVREDDTLLDVAFRHRLGFSAVQRLNPDVDVWLPEPGTPVLLPTSVVLPDAAPDGLVINVPEMRLYDFTVGPVPEIFAIAIGDDMTATPEGDFRVGPKRVNPTWYVPDSIRAENPDLPAQVPPGPDNPLGDRWMTVGNTAYGIHGTNVEWSIGRIATHGCIRLYSDEMRRLYERVPEGTPLRFVYQPIKVGVRDGDIYLEVHPDVYGRRDVSPERAYVRLRLLAMLGLLDADSLDRSLVERTVREARGVPVRVASAAGEPAP